LTQKEGAGGGGGLQENKMKLSKEQRKEIKSITSYFAKNYKIALSTIEEQVENMLEEGVEIDTKDLTELLISQEWVSLQMDYLRLKGNNYAVRH
jgi:hypothetical protein